MKVSVYCFPFWKKILLWVFETMVWPISQDITLFQYWVSAHMPVCRHEHKFMLRFCFLKCSHTNSWNIYELSCNKQHESIPECIYYGTLWFSLLFYKTEVAQCGRCELHLCRLEKRFKMSIHPGIKQHPCCRRWNSLFYQCSHGKNLLVIKL